MPHTKRVWPRETTLNDVFFQMITLENLRNEVNGTFLFQVVPWIFHRYFTWNLKCRAMWAGHALRNIANTQQSQLWSCLIVVLSFSMITKLGKVVRLKPDEPYQLQWPWATVLKINYECAITLLWTWLLSFVCFWQWTHFLQKMSLGDISMCT